MSKLEYANYFVNQNELSLWFKDSSNFSVVSKSFSQTEEIVKSYKKVKGLFISEIYITDKERKRG